MIEQRVVIYRGADGDVSVNAVVQDGELDEKRTLSIEGAQND